MLKERLSQIRHLVEFGQGKDADKKTASRMTPGSQSKWLEKQKLSNSQQ